MSVSKTKTTFASKYWFARGYADAVMGEMFDPPSSEVNDYYQEICNLDIVKEFSSGFEQGQKDKINGII